MGFAKAAFVIKIMFLAIIILPKVKGDQGLITSVCSKTIFPFYCERCFNSTPGSETQDLAHLAGTIISCANNQAPIVKQISLDFSRTSSGWFQEQLVEWCLPNIDSMTRNLAAAFELWKASNYYDASTMLGRAGDDFALCTRHVASGGFTPPQALVVQYTFMNADIEDGGQIVRMLL